MAAVDKTTKRLYLKTKRALQDIMPTVQEAPGVVSVPHTDETVRVLSNLGMNVRGLEPIQHYWNWPSHGGTNDLRPYQKTTSAFLSVGPRAYCLHPPRMGKTSAALAAGHYLYDTKQINGMLVVCPLSALGDWKREAFALRPNDAPLVLHGKTRDALQGGEHPRKIYLINPAGVLAEAKNIAAAIRDGRIGLVIVDEVTEYANKSSLRWRALAAAVAQVPYLWGLTGTPGSALKAYGIMALINPHPHLPKSFVKWRELTHTNTYAHKWVPKPTAADTVHKMMQPAIKFDKADVLDVPTPQIEFLDVELSPKQEALYTEVKKKQIATVNGATLTAVNAGVLLGKLLQISAGVVRDDNGEVILLDPAPRMDALVYYINEKSESKTVIFAHYKAVMTLLEKELQARGVTTARIDGDVAPSKREQIVHAFTVDQDPKVLIAHPITCRFSLELAVADQIIFYGPTMSGAYTYEQAKARILSPKQKSLTPAIVHMQSTDAERRLHRMVMDNAMSDAALVQLFKEVVYT